MPDLNTLLNQYAANTGQAPLNDKMAAVAAAAEQKKAQLDPQGYLGGAARDVGYGDTSTVDPLAPIDITGMIARAAGDSRYIQEASHQRTGIQAVGDNFNSAAQATFMTPLEIANLGVSAVSPDAGAAVNDFVQHGLENAQGKQSDALNDRRRAYAARSQVTSGVNDVKYNDEVGKGDSKLIAGLRREGRNAIDALENTDGVLASDLIANAAGSLVTSGPIGEGIGLIGRGLLKAGMKSGAVGFSGARNALSLGSKIEMPLSIGLQEAGGVGHQTQAQVLATSHEDLLSNSPEYRDAISLGMSPDEARNYVARNAGLEAAAIQFPIAAATGKLVEKFEANPLGGAVSKGKAGSLIVNAARETVEEGIQSGTGQIAQNVGTQQNANENQDLLAGVGEQAAQGALGGLGSAGIVGGPGAVLKAAADTVGGAAKLAVQGAQAVKGAVDSRAAALKAANEKASPTSDESVRSAVDAVATVAPDLQATVDQALGETKADDAKKAQGSAYVSKLIQATQLSPDEVNAPNLPANVQETLAGSKDRLDAMHKLAGIVHNSDDGSEEQLTAAAALYNTMSVIHDALQQPDTGAIDELPGDHPVKEMLAHYQDVVSSITQSSSVMGALSKVDAIAKAANQNGNLDPVSEEELATPEGQQRVHNTVAVAEASPQNGNLEANQQILLHAEQGKVNVTPSQRAALQASNAVLQAEQARQEEIARLKLKTNNDIVSEEILTKDSGAETDAPSVAEHVKRIVAAARAGDSELAAEYLNSLVRFAQHMQNKVAALNTALETGASSDKNTVKYDVLTKSGKFRPGKDGLYLNPYTPGGVRNAQQTASDARIVAEVANDLVKIFPDLKINPVQAVELHKSLTTGTAEEVAKAYREGRAKAEPKKAEPAATANSEPAPKQEQSSTPEPAETGQPKGGDQSAASDASSVPNTQTQETKAETKSEPDQPVEQSPAVETKQEASPAEEAAPAQAETDAGATAEAAKPEPKKTIAELFPKLPGWSRLSKAFRVPEEARTRIIGTDSPMATIRDALSSADALKSFIGSNLKHEFTPEIADQYSKMLNTAQGIMDIMSRRLAESKEKARFLKGEDRMPSFRNGRMLNITDEVNGDLVYNQQLLEQAALAATQWLLIANNFKSELKDEDVADILKIKRDEFSDTIFDPKTGEMVSLTKKLNKGLGLVEAKRSLARMIKSYWGLSEQKGAYIGQVEGIPEAIAAELLHSMVENGNLGRTEWQITKANGLSEGTKDVYVFTPADLGQDNPIYSFPNAIDQVVQTDPNSEGVTYIGEAPTKVADTQLRNSLVKLTDGQKKAIAFEQKQQHFANMTMVNLFLNGLKNAGSIELFGEGDLTGLVLNETDKKSKEGKNQTIGSSFRSLQKVIAELKSKAAVAGVEMDQLPIFYDYVFTRVNRMQMLGLNNPQASKIMREAILPTRVTVDLSNQNSDQFNNFTLALAQALGVKVHTQSLADNRAAVAKKLAQQLKGSVEILQSWLNDQSQPLTVEQIATIKNELGKDSTPVALHALTEFARYKNADEAGRKAFTTSLYVEADGVTNGPANAMQVLTTGRFTAAWVKKMRKVGLFLGSLGRSMNEYRQIDENDTYKETSNRLSQYMADLKKRLSKSDTGAAEHLDALNRLMGEFIGDAVFKGQDLEFDRGIAKNPLTITIYGSGAKGIAGKVAKELMGEIYKRLSNAAQQEGNAEGKTFAEFMFPNNAGPEDAAEKLARFKSDISALTTDIVKNEFGDLVLAQGEDAGPLKFDVKSFALEQAHFENLRSNFNILFVRQLQNAIRDVIGPELLGSYDKGAKIDGSTDLLRKAIQIQSIVQQHAFQKAIEEKLAEKKANDPEWSKDDFLTRDELKEIYTKIADLSPIMDTGDQRYYIAGKESADIGDDNFHFGSAFDDQLRTPAYIDGPADAGVAGIPAMVIGIDGLMMQLLSTTNAVERTLKVFDGMHLPLDNLVGGSQAANEAVFKAWMSNPLDAVSKSYTTFLGALSSISLRDLNKKQLAALSRAFNYPEGMTASIKELEKRIQELGPKLDHAARDVELRHQAMAKVGLSVDQMAAVGAPFVNDGDVSLEGLSDERIAQKLNELAREEHNKAKTEAAPKTKAEPKTEAKPETKVQTQTKKPVSENIAPELQTVGRLLKNGARVISHTALKKLVRSLSIPSEQRDVLGDVLRTLTTKEYKIVYGTPEQVRAYADERGIDLGGDLTEGGEKKVNGFIDPNSQTIFIHNPTSEILLHELIHAATFDKLVAYYNGENLGPNHDEQVKAIQRIEALMKQFLASSMHGQDPETQKAFFDAADEIDGRLAKGQKAAALNEFMAWSLANQNLIEHGKATEVAGTDARIGEITDTLAHRYKAKIAEVYGEQEFNDTARTNFVRDVRAYINGTLKSVSAALKNLIRKVLGVALAAGIVFSTTAVAPFSPAKASVTVEHVETVPADAAKEMSSVAQQVYQTLAPIAKEQGKGFFIADKPNGKIHVFGKDGRHITSATALYGKTTGDDLGRAGLRGGITPSGSYTVKFENSDYKGGKIARLYTPGSNDEMSVGGVAIHSVYLGKPSENRLGRLASTTVSDNKISHGCINTTEQAIVESIVPNMAELNGGTVFVISENADNLTQLPASHIDTKTAKPEPENDNTPSKEMGGGVALGAVIAANGRRKKSGQSEQAATPSLVQLSRQAAQLIKQMVFGRRAPKLKAPGLDVYSNLRFNTNILMQSKYEARQHFATTMLAHSTAYGSNERLTQLNDSMYRTLISHLRDDFSSRHAKLRTADIDAEARKILASQDAVLNIVDKAFTMDAQERSTFQLMAAVLATSFTLDPNALTRVQDLYSHVVKNIHPDNFLAFEDASDPAKQFKAEQKVNLIVGDLGTVKDAKGRSSLLPVFLALATVNEQFRSVLQKMEVPKAEQRTDKTLDAWFTNLSTKAMENLSVHVSGEGRNSPNIQASVDALLDRVVNVADDRASFLAQFASPTGSALDAANTFFKDTFQSLAEAAYDAADKVTAATNNKLVQSIAQLAKGFAAMVDEKKGPEVFEGFISGLNRSNYATAFREFVVDLIGRTKSNANVYDMIKKTNDVVQRQRQQFREHLPKVIAERFTRKITESEWTAMFHGFGKTDLAVLRSNMSRQRILDLIADETKRTKQISQLEQHLQKLDPKHWQLIQKKTKQLAHFMNTGEVGQSLLRNAVAVANLANEGLKRPPADEKLIRTVDELATLYAYEGLAPETKEALSSLAQEQGDGISFLVDYMVGQRADELAKANRNGADVNHYKGYMPVENHGGMTLIVADDADHADLVAKSFVRVGDYKGSYLGRGTKKGYYFSPVSGRAPYNQGIMQNVRPTAYGVDLASGFTHGLTGGRIEDPARVKQITRMLKSDFGAEPLLPVFDSAFNVVAYERSIDPKKLSMLKQETNLSKVVGIWQGRQLEEMQAQVINEELVDHLHEMWETDTTKNPSNKDQYVDLRDPEVLKADPVLADAVRLFSHDTQLKIDSRFGGHFYVRRDMLNDAIGYRSASIGDLWTKNSRLNPKLLDTAQNVAMAAFGNKAYRYLTTAEKMIQSLATDSRVLIVVKSVVVTASNLMANVYQLAGNGVSVLDIGRGMPKKTAEVSSYLKSRLRLDEADAELRQTSDPIERRKLEAEMQSINDIHRRMSIWPLIEAGEFSSISDGTLTHEDLELTEGRLSEWIEKKVDQIPNETLRQIGKYAIISRDTALFQALQKSVEYGDFLAKAVLYDHLTKREKRSSEEALAKIREEFVNYARLPGRSRGYIESLGLAWFYNYKIRSVKVAASMIRNNPVHALISMAVPAPPLFGSVGSPMTDNLFSLAGSGRLGWSIGPGMGLRAHQMNPVLEVMGF